MQRLILLILFTPLFTNAQESKGIKFISGYTWEQVKSIAKKENKYIFVDCIATWCLPCKKMASEVFVSGKIGNYFNERFISIKVQMDTTKKDDSLTKSWYSVANCFKEEFKITGYPTFLFFSPDGDVVHKFFGFKQIDYFLQLSIEALDSSKQYYTLLNKYQEGRCTYPEMANLIVAARSFGEKDIADTIAYNYTNNYLLKLSEDELFTIQNIVFLRSATHGSKDKGFSFFYNHQYRIDQIIGRVGYADEVVEAVISTEEIYPFMLKPDRTFLDEVPNWKKISKSIKRKYNRYFAGKLVTNAKVLWFRKKNNLPEYCKNITKILQKYSDKTNTFFLNNDVWDIFLYSENKKQLNISLKFMERRIALEPNVAPYIDTYANLLYKLGFVEKALEWEQKAVELAPEDKEILGAFSKMKAGIPTWHISNK